jgi:hypothetical protein
MRAGAFLVPAAQSSPENKTTVAYRQATGANSQGERNSDLVEPQAIDIGIGVILQSSRRTRQE